MRIRGRFAAGAAAGLLCCILSPAPAPAQDRYTFSNGELVPPLSFTEQDFKRGFQKSYRIPDYPEGQRDGSDTRSGTIVLRYAPGTRPRDEFVHATVDYRVKYQDTICNDDDECTERWFTFSVSWSGDLEPLDDDPEGKLPARGYVVGPDAIRTVQNSHPNFRLGPRPIFSLRLILVEEVEGAINRTPYLLVQLSETMVLAKQSSRPKDNPPRVTGVNDLFGPLAPGQEDEEKSLVLEGCSDLLKGGKGQLTAKAKGSGGKYEWRAEPSSVLTVAGSGSTANLSGKSTGRATVRVERETKDGEKIEAEKSGSVVELRSVNNGAAVPQIALVDDKGVSQPPISVPVVQNPGEGDLLDFPVADPGVATVQNLGSTLLIQGIREGKTTTQAQTLCKERTGPVVDLEVVRCSKETVARVREELRMVEVRLKAGAVQLAEVLGDPEFERASKEIEDDTMELATSTAELISSVMGVGAKAGKVTVDKGAEVADTLAGATGAVKGYANGALEGNPDAMAEALLDVTLQAVDATILGAARTAIKAGQAAQKFGRDLGSLFGTADRIKEIEEARDKTFKEREEVARRLYDVCKSKKTDPKEPPPPSKPGPPTRPKTDPGKPPPGKPPPPKAEPPTSQDTPPAEPAGGEPTTGSGGEKPPPAEPPPPPKPPRSSRGAAGGGIPLDCGCDKWKQGSWGSDGKGLGAVAGDLRDSSLCLQNFQEKTLTGFRSDLDLLAGALKEFSQARALPDKQRRAGFRSFLNKTNGLPERLEKFSGEASRLDESMKGCGKSAGKAAEMIRKGSEKAAREMIRK